jgi:serine O-acetyltransferase
MFDCLRADLAHRYLLEAGLRTPPLSRRLRVLLDSPSLQGIVVFRFGSFLHGCRLPWLIRKPLGILYFLLDTMTVAMWGIHIDPRAQIGEGLYIGHTGGILIGPVTMGPDCCVAHNVTLGLRTDGKAPGVPQIGTRVWFGTGAVVFGGITIGDGATIAPLTVVGRNVAPRSLVAGNPMLVLSRNYDNTIQVFGGRIETPENH